MSNDLTMQPIYQATMQRLEAQKHISPKGVPYWLAREIMPTMGYQSWRNFEKTLARAKQAFGSIHEDADKHFVETDTMVSIGSGALGRRSQPQKNSN